MKRAFRAPSRIKAPFSHGGSPMLVVGMLVASLGCTGRLADGNDPLGGTGGGSGAGTGSSTGSGSGSGSGGAKQGTGGAGGDPYAIPTTPPASVIVATPRLARLSRQQWANAVRDLLKLTDISDVDANVSGDALHGFDDEADSLFVTEQLRGQLFDASEALAGKVTGDATALARLVPANAPTDTAGRGKAFITSFGQRAFRRPLTDAEVTTHVGLFSKGPTLYPGGDAFKSGVSLVIQALLQSPYFLYRTELEKASAGAKKVALNDWEVGAKLALAITNTIPDDTMLAAAAAGKLHDAAGVATQVNRLFDGATGVNGLSNFNAQVYRLGAYDGITRNAADFPDFKPNAPASMKSEVLQFLSGIFRGNGGIKEFYTMPVGYVSSLLAPIYGLTGNYSSDPLMLTKVDLDPKQRSGLLTQAGFLSSYLSIGNEPDIIHRGVFIAERLLCKELPPPDPKALGTMIPNTPNMTNRERVEATTGKGTCGEACHGTLFNALGYAFENYDGIGKYRTMDQGKTVNAADSYRLDGQLKSFSNGIELSRLLADAKETHDCYIRNMMGYLHGRVLDPDQENATVDYLARRSRAGMTLHDLELAIVTSDAFLNRLP